MELLTEPAEELTETVKLKPLKLEHNKVLTLILAGERPAAAYSQVYDCAANTAMQASSRLMRNGTFKAHLARARDELARSSKLSHGWVLDKLKGIVKDCLDKGKGFNPGVATRALELIGKHLGTFETKDKGTDQRKWIGMRIDYGKGTVEVVAGTGSTDSLKKAEGSEGDKATPRPPLAIDPKSMAIETKD